MTRLLFYLFGAMFHRMLAANELRPKGMEGLVYAFSGTDGKAYYTWRDVGDLPAIRTKRIEEYLVWIDAKTTKKSIAQVVDDVTKQLPNVIEPKSAADRSKNAAKIGAYLQEMLIRSESIVPEELYYAMAAVCVVREDEEPAGLDDVIHDQKIAMLRAAGKAGGAFFQQVPPFKQLFKAWLTSAEGFGELLISWTMERERVRAIRSALGFESASRSTGNLSMTSR